MAQPIVMASAGGPAGSPPARVAPAESALYRASPVVRTDRAAVLGKRERGVDSFLGIRYASSPVGKLRWAPPRRADRWKGTRRATEFGNGCPATESGNGPRAEVEDCLYVNVQRPAGLRRGDRRPVYVFFHGGGLANGSSSQHDSAPLVRKSGIVAVTLNYRLGVFGFLGHPALTAAQGQSGNYGLMDQQAALRWVQRNIAKFGGDPHQVTIGGESAGGWSVCAHLVAPASRRLFDGAVIQSGSYPSVSQQDAEGAGSSIAEAVGCSNPATAVSCLRKTVGSLLDNSQDFFWAPVRGTRFLPADPREAISNGQFRRVPVVIGANRDEGRTFLSGSIGMTQSEYLDGVHETFGPAADAVIDQYPWPSHSDQFTGAYLAGAYVTDAGLAADIGGCPNRQLTKDLARYTPPGPTSSPTAPVPARRWNPSDTSGVPDTRPSSYFYPNFNLIPVTPTFDRSERRLAREMKRYWGSFGLKRDPNVDGQARWPRYDRTGQVLSLRAGGKSKLISDATLAHEHKCAFWEELETQ